MENLESNSANLETSVTFTVTTAQDENDGDYSARDLSLREAIALANDTQGTNTITFDSSLNNATVTLTGGELVITDSVTINGAGNITVDGNNNSRVLQINDGDDATNIDVTLAGLTVTGGNAGNSDTDLGGGIDNQENLTVTESVISGNSAGLGGGISNQGNGNLVLDRSTVDDNSATYSNGGGVLNAANWDREQVIDGSFDRNDATVTITNSTISNNSARFGGNGILNDSLLVVENSTISGNFALDANTENIGGGINDPAFSIIDNTTITNNSADLGSGFSNSSGATTITSSLIAGNANNDDLEERQGDRTPFISGGNNLIGNGDTTNAFVNGVNSDIVGSGNNPIDAKLGNLQDNGGAIFTHALLQDSPAIDTGSNPNNLTTDQRGDGFSRTVGNGTDIGAYEVQDGGEIPTELIVSTLEDEDDGDYSAGDLSLREAIALANSAGDLSLREAIALANSNDTISFASNLSNGTITLTLGELSIDKSLTINGLGANNLTISGNNQSGVFLIDDRDSSQQIDVSINDLTITQGERSNGSFPEINGGGIFNQENLSLTNIALIDNDAGNGGAIYTTGQLDLQNSLIGQNSGGTGAIYNDGGFLSISNTTMTDNGFAGIGAIVNTAGGELKLTNSTITNNNSFDAAVFNGEDSTAAIASTIIAGNSGEIIPERDDIIGTFISNGNNLIGNSNGGNGFDEPTDIVGTADNTIDAKLGDLQDNGGATQTIALLPDSPAIDTGSNPNNLTTDQRGDGFNRTVGNGTDIGAYEVQDINNPPDGEKTIGTDAADTLVGAAGNDTLLSQGGDDLVFGEGGDDFVNGGAGNDLVNGGIGNDDLRGGSNDDRLDGAEGDDSVYGNIGDDTVRGGAGNDFLRGDAGNDLIQGGEGNDTLDGGNDTDILNGGAGDDLIIAGSGDDLITGGSGNDTLTGGSGDDFFFLESGNGEDVITDFVVGSDRFKLTGGLTFGNLNLVDDAANNSVIIQDATDNMAIAIVNNLDVADLTADSFI
ncbi:MAG: hypothetical protein Tsb0014_21080 [Pleurocapsa sp.]